MKKVFKTILSCLFVIIMCLSFSSCGKKNIVLEDNGKVKEYTTSKSTVKDFLSDNNIQIGKDDKMSLPLDSAINNNSKIIITRIKIRNIKRTKKIKYKKETKYSSELYEGEDKLEQKGQNGKKEITYYYRYVNGYLKEKRVISKKTLKKPKNQITVVGTKKRSIPSTNNGNNRDDKRHSSGVREVSRQKVYDCDGSGHGIML